MSLAVATPPAAPWFEDLPVGTVFAAAPAPSAAARSSSASTSRASAISSSVGVNASRRASSWAGWIAHLPSKPSARALLTLARKAASSRVARCGPSIAWRPAARAATSTLSWAKRQSCDAPPPVRPSEAARSA